MILPVRKCYYVLKLSLLLVIVVALLTFFEKWRGGKRGAGAFIGITMDDLEFERQIQEDEARFIPGLGEEGRAAYLEGEDRRLGEESEKKLAINVHLSDRISYNRTLQDARNEACKRVVYDAELPSASVVIIFHNEPYSVVMRTVWSVLNSVRRDKPWYQKANYADRNGKRMQLGYPGQDPSSPYVYLKEVILVDDNSTLPELRGKLDYYIQTRLPRGLVRVIRLPERRGLMSARMTGARAARGSILVFLDAHCELQPDWLRPLLSRVQQKRDAAVTPLIDVIDQGTFKLDAAEEFQVGGFTFSGHFTWIDVSEREKKRRGSDIAPTWSPTMAGGLFAMDRAYFWQLGAYDEQMAGWGGENLEMSFRVWQCGGTLETIPCSRAGHVFRSFHPYAAPRDSHAANTARAADVWMDRYSELYYLWRPDLRKSPLVGDTTHRKVLREKLKCKSFQWYLDHVYPDKFVPVRDSSAFGRFRNPSSGLCLDSLQRSETAAPLGLYPCHPALQPSQMYSLGGEGGEGGTGGQLRDEERCATLPHQREPSREGRRVLMVNCRPNQKSLMWRLLPSRQLQHVSTGLCLTSRGSGADGDVLAEPCEDTPYQAWRPDLDGDSLEDRNVISHDQLTELLKLKKHGPRVSRSLRSHRRARPPANKFILRLQRTLPAGPQHVEAHILCPHETLLANNTLVRDLVRILNTHDIEVINNGRVFDKTGVHDLKEWEESHPLALRTASLGATLPPHDVTARESSGEDPGSVPAPPQHAPPATKRPHKSHKKHKRKHTTPADDSEAADRVTRPARHHTKSPRAKSKSKLKSKSKSKYKSSKSSQTKSPHSGENDFEPLQHSHEDGKNKKRPISKEIEKPVKSKKDRHSSESEKNARQSSYSHEADVKSKKSSDEFKSKKTSDEFKSKKTSDEFKSKKTSDEFKSKKTSDEFKSKKTSDEFKSKKTSDELKSLKNEVPIKSLKNALVQAALQPTDSKSNEVWRVGVSRFRVVPSPKRTGANLRTADTQESLELTLDAGDPRAKDTGTHRSNTVDHDKSERGARASSRQAPVARAPERAPEVLVQGNITFELDDSMINFRAQSYNDDEPVFTNSSEVAEGPLFRGPPDPPSEYPFPPEHPSPSKHYSSNEDSSGDNSRSDT